MGISNAELPITWPGPSASVPTNGSVTSEILSIDETSGACSISIKAENQGTPVAADVVYFWLLQTNGDTDGTGGADEFDTPANATPIGFIDTFDANPGNDTLCFPVPQKAFRIYAEGTTAGTTQAITVSAVVLEKRVSGDPPPPGIPNVSNLAFTFGRLTRTAAGAAEIADAASGSNSGSPATSLVISTDDPTNPGHWQVNGTAIEPTAAGEDSLAPTYSLGLTYSGFGGADSETTATITTTVNAYSFDSYAEIIAARTHNAGNLTNQFLPRSTTQASVRAEIGQSNDVGRAGYDSLGDYPDAAFQYNQAGEIVIASETLNHFGTNTGLMGFQITLADAFVAARPNTILIFVPSAQGGTGFYPPEEDWNPGDVLYNAAVARTNAVTDLSTGFVLDAFDWLQGEEDIDPAPASINAYKGNLYAMIPAIRAACTGATNITPFILGELSPEWVANDLQGGVSADKQVLQGVIQGTPNDINNTYTVSATGLLGKPGDEIHYAAPALRSLGPLYYAGTALAAANNAAAPNQVLNLVATPGTNQVILTWDDAIGNGDAVIDYIVERQVSGGAFSVLSTPVSPVTGFTDTTALNGILYGYRVSAISSAGTGPASTVASATPAGSATVPDQVLNLVATSGDTEIVLTWDTPADGGSAILDYTLERQASGGAFGVVATPVTPTTGFTDTGLTNGTLYGYRVAAVNSVGTGPVSAVDSATPAASVAEAGAAGHWLLGTDNATDADLISGQLLTGPAPTRSAGYITPQTGLQAGMLTSIDDAEVITGIWVARKPVTSAPAIIGGTLTVAADGTSGWSPFWSTSAQRFNNRGGSGAISHPDARITGEFIMMAVSLNAAGDYVYWRGDQTTPVDISGNAARNWVPAETRKLAVGNTHWDFAGYDVNPDIAEIIIFNSALTVTELNAIHSRSVTRLASRGITLR